MITPQTEEKALAQALGISSLYLKREDLHPYGSHKGRSIPYMIDRHMSASKNKFVISSSGNAALAAAMYINKLANEGKEAYLRILVGKNINKEKLALLKSHAKAPIIRIEQTERPLQTLKKHEDAGESSLRQSKDDMALVGYHELAKELAGIKNLRAVFVGMSSGTTIQGLHEGFKALGKDIRLFGVQTSSCHPIAEAFDAEAIGDDETKEKSIADAIIDKSVPRREIILDVLKESNGGAYMVSDDMIKEAQSAAKKYGDVAATANGVLGIAGLMKALSKEMRFDGAVACIVTGR